ncbi:hypothetical protein [Psychroflexus sp. MBR-150]|jgi:hypothetical protein
MKRHKVKTIVFKILDVLPKRIGYWAYHGFQKITLKEVSFYQHTNRKSFNQIKKILRNNKVNLEGKNVLEIGSGWFPIIPILFKNELNINKCYTFDINEHYSKKRIKSTLKIFENNFKTNKNNLPSFIKYFPSTNVSNFKINDNIDFVISRFVLEHISEDELLKIHYHLYNQISKSAQILHLISPSDHRAYSDKSLSLYDFLKYSDKEWDKIQTKFDYHNRLRLPDYINIFKKAGFKIEFLNYEDVNKNSDKYKKFKKLNIHYDYKKYSEQEILASSITVLLSK